MVKSIGLRTEIIFHITLLLGAALLFGGFLMIKLTERELLNQRLDNLASMVDFAARSVGQTLTFDHVDSSQKERLARLQPLLPEASTLEIWKLEGNNLISFYQRLPDGQLPATDSKLQSLRFIAEPQEQFVYSGAWFVWGEFPSSYFETTLPIRQHGKLVGVLQARFPLEGVIRRVRSFLNILFIYVFLYGTVLFFFGLYLLNRNVVRPIDSLVVTTRQVAAGDLHQRADEQGPREIASLARSFNDMVVALDESRRRTDQHIHSLQEANAELKEAWDELVRSEKMASVGHLAAGMAHEIGNPLAAVVGYLELLKADLPAGRQQQIAKYAAEEVERIDRLVRELLDYAMPGDEQPISFDPLSVVREAVALLDHQGRFGAVKLVDEMPRQMPKIVMIRHRLLQVFVNLLINACDSLAEGGKIHLSTDQNDDTVWLKVADNGNGISSEDLPHIFDPFFTTKAPGKGRGLGLALCYRVVEEAGGAIEVQSMPGQGSVFTIRLKREVADHAG